MYLVMMMKPVIVLGVKDLCIIKWSMRWISLELLSVVCLIVTIAAGLGSMVGVLLDLQKYKPFSSDY